MSLRWGAPDCTALRTFLVERHSFNEARVAKMIERLQKLSASGQQTRLDSFFVSKGAKPVAQEAKFDPFAKKKGGASGSGAKGGKRPAQFATQLASDESSLAPGLSMHLSKQMSVSFEMAAWMTAFWFSDSMNCCSSRVCDSLGSASMAACATIGFPRVKSVDCCGG